jgi:hypothetical protein
VDIGKMIKLENILKEIEVGFPLSKKEILNWWFDEGNIYLLSYLTTSPSLNQFLSDVGYDDLKYYLEDEFGFEENIIPKVIEYIEAYYKVFKPNEIYVTTFGDRYGTHSKGTSYKNIEIDYIGDGYYSLYCNNY